MTPKETPFRQSFKNRRHLKLMDIMCPTPAGGTFDIALPLFASLGAIGYDGGAVTRREDARGDLCPPFGRRGRCLS